MPFGIIKNYNKIGVRGMVKDQLEIMYLEGQRKIGVNFFHGRGNQWFEHGTYINTRAKLDKKFNVYYIDPIYLNNLSLFLTDIKNQGYNELLFNVVPHGCNNPTVWVNFYLACKKDIDYTFVQGTTTLIKTGYNPNDPEPRWQQTPIWRENWKVLKKLTKILESSTINYKIDLYGEAIPSDDFESGFARDCSNLNQSQCLKNYPQELNLFLDRIIKLLNNRWTKYINNFGKLKTHGFSIIAQNLSSAKHRWATMQSIYGGNYPNHLNLHMYISNKRDAKNVFNFFKGKFPSTPIVIGETYYNDYLSATYIRDALTESNTSIEYLIQWPIDRNVGYKHAPPLDFDNYINKGF